MKNLLINNLDDKIFIALQNLAKLNDRTMEEEIKSILQQAVSKILPMGELSVKTFGTINGIELELKKHDPDDPIFFK